jgi:hypothetical protein
MKNYLSMNKNNSIKDSDAKDSQPSSTEDCADVTSKYDKYIKDLNKPKFPPIDYERPPHF